MRPGTPARQELVSLDSREGGTAGKAGERDHADAGGLFFQMPPPGISMPKLLEGIYPSAALHVNIAVHSYQITCQ